MENGRSFLLTAGSSRAANLQVAILNDLRAPSAKRTATSGGVEMNKMVNPRIEGCSFYRGNAGPDMWITGKRTVNATRTKQAR
jgi:hypothetical protein